MVFASGLIAVSLGLSLARRFNVFPDRLFGIAGSAAILSIVFIPISMPFMSIRQWLHAFLDEQRILQFPITEAFRSDGFEALNALVDVQYSKLVADTIQVIADSVQAALIETAIFFPLLMIGLTLWRLCQRAVPGGLPNENKKRYKKNLIGLSCGAFGVAAGIACFSIVWVSEAESNISSLFGLNHLFSTPKGSFLPDPCDERDNWREYNVSAIDVRMVLNRFGDLDEDAFMYVLDENKEAVEDWQQLPGCTRWNENDEMPKTHRSCVSPGLRKDLAQPLVLRANLGQCLVINFTNRLDPNKKPPISRRFFPRANDGKASIHINGLAHSAENAGGRVGNNSDSFAETGEAVTYKIPLPTDPAAERAYYFHDGGANRQRVPHGLFGVIVVEPAGSRYLDPESGEISDGSGWEAIIQTSDQPNFREFVLIYHEIGDEDFSHIVDGSAESTIAESRFLPQLSGMPPSLGTLYRPSGRAINYRSEPFQHRLLINPDNRATAPYIEKKALGYSSYTFGDPATPIPRSYLGEPSKTRLVHGGSEVFHVHHLHGGADRWRRNPKSDPHNDISSGLNKRPHQHVFSTHLDSQSIGPGTSYNLEHECGAGGCQQAAGDFLYHCHIGQHYLTGMWGLWRVFDTHQEDMVRLPDMPAPPEAIDSTQLLGKTFEGKMIVLDAKADDSSEVSLSDWVESQLPPKGERIDHMDATVWDWTISQKDGLPLYLGEPETEDEWANYTPESKGERFPIRFNPNNGRYAWPIFRPHLGQRPPFSPGGHSGTPWLGEKGSAERPDGLCPDPNQWNIPGQTIRHYPISAVNIDIPTNLNNVDRAGMLFVLNEDIIGRSLDGKAILSKFKESEPLTIRSNVGDCTRIIFTNKLDQALGQTDSSPGKFQRVNMHTHFVQFDPQASDGVITGFSYEQSVFPYTSERRTAGPEESSHENQPRQLVDAAPAGAENIRVNQIYRLKDNRGAFKKGIWIGIGLGEGIIDPCKTCVPKVEKITPRTEIRRIADILPDEDDNGYTIQLNRPLNLPHDAGEAVGVEFVQYSWYSDVDTGTVFWHDHVDFNTWDHGLVGAHIIEPERATWRHPKTGDRIRSGAIVDIHMPDDASAGAGQMGSFREFVLFNHKQQSGRDSIGERKATINLRSEPINHPDSSVGGGREGAPAFWFSSVTHGDPHTPIPRAYVGDPFVIRHLGVLDRVGGIRITGHRFRLERFAEPGALSDASPIGISERYDLVLDGGAGGSMGKPGDFLYYNTIGRSMIGGAWGLIRVFDTLNPTLKPLPGKAPPRGDGFPQQTAASGINSSKRPAPAPVSGGNPCPPSAPAKDYEVHINETEILLHSQLGDIVKTSAIGSDLSLRIKNGIAYRLAEQPENISTEPLVLRVNHGECLVVNLHNDLKDERAGLHVGELRFDPQASYGSAIGLNLDSSVAPNQSRTYRYYADQELGTVIAFNLSNPVHAARGAFAAVIVEPEGSQYLDPDSGLPIRGGVIADIVAPDREFREMVALFHDSDPIVGQNDMAYEWMAHCFPNGITNVPGPSCTRTSSVFPSGSFTSLSYNVNPWELRDNNNQAPSEVYSSLFGQNGDPRWVVEGEPGQSLLFRVAAPWGEQVHVFSLSGHRWPLEPGMEHSEQVFARMLSPGYSFDAPIIGGFGGPYGKTGDYLFLDSRMPFTMAGLWGLIRSREAGDD